MADPKVRFKRSSVPGKIPNETQLPLGEIALNTYDGKVFASKNVGIGTTVFTVNPWNVGTGTDSYDINFTAGNVGVGSTLPTSALSVTGDANISGVVTATSFSGSGTNLTGIVTYITAGSGISIDQSTGNVTITSTGGGAGAGISAIGSADNYIITLTPSFNGITTAFTMQYNGNNYSPLNAQQLLVSLGGVIQEPTTAYTVSSSTITFASAPNTETDYFITALNTAPLSRNAQSYNVTGVQTNFTLTNGYTIGYVDVYLNGARLVSGDDYTATNGTTVGLTSAAQNGDVVEVVGYKAVSLSTDDLVINGNLKVVGITTLGNYVQVGVGSTALIVNGDARVTGILTVGSSSVTIDGINNRINVGTGLTISNGIVATGVITATSFVGDGSGLTGAGSTVVDDTSTNQTLYPVLTAQTSGTITASKVSTTKLSFNPSTGVISGTGFSGSGASLTSLDASQLTSGLVPAARIVETSPLTVNGDLYVAGNISFGGTTTQLNTSQVTFSDPDIVLGVGTTSTFNPTDSTANHGGIAIASTEGYPLVNLNINPNEILPTTYKKFMWFKNNTAGLGTDAWLSNYAVGIGSTQFPTGTRLVAGNVQFDDNDLKVIRHINSSGVVTATSATVSGGNLLVGSTSATGTSSQPLQVTGGAYVSGNLGIGITNPTVKLQLGGETAQFPSSLYINRTSHATSIRAGINLGGDWVIATDVNGNGTRDFGLYSGVLGLSPFRIDTAGNLILNQVGAATSTGTASQPLQVTGGAYISGSFGIGTTNPAYKLDVAGGNVKFNHTGTEQLTVQGSSGGYFFAGYDNANSRARIGSYSGGWTSLSINEGGGNVGVGLTNPGQALDVSGSIRASSQLISTVATGTAPLTVSSTTVVTNLNADLLDGINSSSFLRSDASATNSVDLRAPIFYDSDNTAYYMNGNGESRFYRHRIGPYAGSTSTGGTTGLELINTGGTGESDVAAMAFHCAGSYATHMHLRADSYLGVGGWSASAWRWYVQMSTGDMTAAGNVTAYSDIRLKEEIQPLEGSLNKLLSLNGVSFKWKDLPDIVGHPGKKDYGIIAQEVEKVFPEVIHESAHESPDGDKYKTVAYDKLVPALIEAIKEQQEQINTLRKEIDELKK